MVSTLEQMQVPNGTGPGVRRSKRPLLYKGIYRCAAGMDYFSGLQVHEWVLFSLQKGVSFSPKKYMNRYNLKKVYE